MGIEYIIRFDPPDHHQWELFVKSLDNPISDGCYAFEIKLCEGKILFCDNLGNRQASAVALQRVIDKALSLGKQVIIEEA